MSNQAVFISVMLGAAIFISVIGIFSLVYQCNTKTSRKVKENPSEWLFYNFRHKAYLAFFGEKDSDEVALRFGIKIEQYHKNCALIRKDPESEKIVIHYIYGIMCFLLTVLFSVFFNPLFILLGFLMFFYFTMYEIEKTKLKAEEMRSQVRSELPQFLDLLTTELEVGLPIDSAISILCQKYESLLSREFLESLNEVKLGASGWQMALEKVAEKYDIDILSDFVLDITVAFNKGVSVAHSVIQKTKDIKQKNLLDIREKVGKTENTILIPIALFQFIPMLVFILLPTLLSVGSF